MLQRKISKAIFDALDDHLKGLYKQSGAGYILDVEPDESVSEIHTALEAARKERDEAKKKYGESSAQVAQLQTRVEVLEHEKENIGKTEAEKVEARLKLQQEQMVKEKDGKINELTTALRGDMLGRTSLELAKKLFKSAPEVMAETIIKPRLDLEIKDGKASVVAKAVDGASAITLDLLEKEIVADKRYSDILLGSKASGGGATQPSGGQSGGGATVNLTEQHRQQAAALGLSVPQPFDPSNTRI